MAIRRVIALALATLAVASVASPAFAAKPTGTHIIGGGPPADEPWIPPTAEEQAVIDAKLAMASEVEASSGSSGSGVSPNSFCANSPGTDATSTTSSCVYVPTSYALGTYARRQNNNFYCGPATAQVIINRSRGFYSSNTDGEALPFNYRRQSYIATRLLWYNAAKVRWENTNTIGGTNAYMLTNGLNELARLPSGFAYAVVSTGTGSEWHSKIITDTYQWKMAFGTPVKMTSNSRRLISWRPIVGNAVVVHWVAIRGYNGPWNGTDGPQALYNDSSGAQGGGTGSYSDSSLKMWQLNIWHTARVVW